MMMNKVWPAIALLCAAGCGSHGAADAGTTDMPIAATSLNICLATCTWYSACMPQMLAADCNATCESMAGQYMDLDTWNDQMCKNALSDRQQTLTCLGKSCALVQPCLNAIDTTCIPP